MDNIVKVKYFSESTGELSSREYTYFSVEPLKVGDVVIVPLRDTTGKAKVSAVDVPEAEIAAFRDKVKTIPAGSIIIDRPDRHDFAAPPLIDDEAREVITGGRDEMMEAATASEDKHSPGTDIEVIEWHRQGVGLQEYAEARIIKGLDDLKLANDDLTIIARLKKLMEDRRKYVVQPLNDQVRTINDTYKTLMQPVLDAEAITKQKMLAFNAEQERIRKQQEEINRLRTEAAQKEAAINEGEIFEPVKLVEVIAEAPRHISTDLGSSGMRDNWKWRLIDIKQVPYEYLMVDAAMLNTIAKGHHDQKPIPGIEFYNEPIIATRVR